MNSRDQIKRIAFLFAIDSDYTHQVARGLIRFANPANGSIVREFSLGDELCLPSSFEASRPSAVVAHVKDEHQELLAELAAAGIPVVNTTSRRPAENLGVVIGNAEEVYDLVHAHFHELGISEVHQYVLGDSAGGRSNRQQYAQYAEERGISFRSFLQPNDPQHLLELDRIASVDPSTETWLRDTPKPIGIFSQNNLAGPYLCRMCAVLGLNVPQQVAIIGADSFDFSLASKPEATSFRVPGEKVGYEAGKLVVAMLQGAPAPTEPVRVRGARLIKRASTGGPRLAHGDIGAALAFIDEHACEGIKVNDVVSHTQCVSRVTFHKRFLEMTGITPAEAISQRRLREARRLLSQTRLSVVAISGMCGFNDQLYFSQVFRKVEGVSPRDYRRFQVEE
jgi:LacI family transcriptional regulator